MDEELCCILCKEEFNEDDPAVSVKEKGLKTLIRLSKERDLEDLHRYKIILRVFNTDC